MNLLRRTIRLLLTILAFVAGLVVGLAAFFTRQMIRPMRQRLWAVPSDAGLEYEDVEFPARDGLRVSGWFIPAASEDGKLSATIIVVHGWPWNRLGEAADSLFAGLTGATPVDLLRLTHALHQAGYHVLSIDLRNHGQSADGGPVTFGLQESNDLLGALEYLGQRPDVDSDRVGAIGFSVGANTILFALPHTKQIRAAMAVQPTSPSVFAARFADDLLGPLGRPVQLVSEFLYEKLGGMPLSAIEPVFVAPSAGDTPLLYVQGKGDRWGSISNVAHMAEKTPNTIDTQFVESEHRFEGYRYVVDNPDVAINFFARFL